jgi:hypothetical protein
MYKNYAWVAMLDPVEFADSDRHSGDVTSAAPIEIDAVGEADHYGRLAWEALVHPTTAYEPRCRCCSLLFGSHILTEDLGAANALYLDPRFRFPEVHRVRLDVATGVCVLTEEMDGSRAGTGHELRIDGVDEVMPDELFATRRVPQRRRRR